MQPAGSLEESCHQNCHKRTENDGSGTQQSISNIVVTVYYNMYIIIDFYNITSYDVAVYYSPGRRIFMKKYYSLIFLFMLIITLSACTAKPESRVMKTALADTMPASSAATVQKPYINEKLGFSFAIPDSWERENYTAQVAVEEWKETKKIVKYTTVSFIFQEDKENPLLTIKIVPKSWWDSTDKKLDGTAPDYLGSKDNLIYCYSLPQACPYDVGKKADLYNSMVLLRDDVPNRFKILDDDTAQTSSATK